jgi:hypothetical protein
VSNRNKRSRPADQAVVREQLGSTKGDLHACGQPSVSESGGPIEIDAPRPLYEVSIDGLRAENEGGGPVELCACLVAQGV